MIIYLDTSVWSSVRGDCHSAVTKKFFQRIRDEQYTVVVSDVLIDELGDAPQAVYQYMLGWPHRTLYKSSFNSVALAHRYIDAGALTNKSFDDALHIALATSSDAHTLFSWNYKHIVNDTDILSALKDRGSQSANASLVP